MRGANISSIKMSHDTISVSQLNFQVVANFEPARSKVNVNDISIQNTALQGMHA